MLSDDYVIEMIKWVNYGIGRAKSISKVVYFLRKLGKILIQKSGKKCV
jgi:hypothetical protein